MHKCMVQISKNTGNIFVFLVLFILGIVYYQFVFLVWGPSLFDSTLSTVVLMVWHFLVLMFLWALLQTLLTDPGRVPIYWGFYMGDPENKRKRYCLMCNVFKPDRCHHCSACNRCVLNMDHHCPWVNNCVGFWNRKFFLLLLFYGLASLFFFAVTMLGNFIRTVEWHLTAYTETGNFDLKECIINCLCDATYIFVLFLFFVLVKFTLFHITLVKKNMTTLESLEHKGTDYESVYDVGEHNNWCQVFGRNPGLWFVPLMGRSGKPDGSGISWPTKHTAMINNEDPIGTDEISETNKDNGNIRGQDGTRNSGIGGSISSISKGVQGDPGKTNVLLNPVIDQKIDMEQIVKKDKGSYGSSGYKDNDSTHPPRSNNGVGLNSIQIHNDNSKETEPPASSIKKGIKQGSSQSPAQANIPPPPKRNARPIQSSGRVTPNSQHNHSTDRLK